MQEIIGVIGATILGLLGFIGQRLLSRLDSLEKEKTELAARLTSLETRVDTSLRYIEDHVGRIFTNLEHINERLDKR